MTHIFMHMIATFSLVCVYTRHRRIPNHERPDIARLICPPPQPETAEALKCGLKKEYDGIAAFGKLATVVGGMTVTPAHVI
jgi:hypothetical protein